MSNKMWRILATVDVAVYATEAAPPSAAQPLLAVRDVAVRFGGIVALDGVSFDLRPGQLLGLIGPNGAGKTTLFNCLSRLYTPVAGDILIEGRSILTTPPHRIVDIGISRTFQNLALFGSMSVLDNIRVGGHRQIRGNFFSDAMRLPGAVRRDAAQARRSPRSARADLPLVHQRTWHTGPRRGEGAV